MPDPNEMNAPMEEKAMGEAHPAPDQNALKEMQDEMKARMLESFKFPLTIKFDEKTEEVILIEGDKSELKRSLNTPEAMTLITSVGVYKESFIADQA